MNILIGIGVGIIGALIILLLVAPAIRTIKFIHRKGIKPTGALLKFWFNMWLEDIIAAMKS